MADQPTFRDKLAAEYVWSGDFTDGPDELTADAVLALPEMEQIRRLIAGALAVDDTIDPRIDRSAYETTWRAFDDALEALPECVRAWASEGDTNG